MMLKTPASSSSLTAASAPRVVSRWSNLPGLYTQVLHPGSAPGFCTQGSAPRVLHRVTLLQRFSVAVPCPSRCGRKRPSPAQVSPAPPSHYTTRELNAMMPPADGQVTSRQVV